MGDKLSLVDSYFVYGYIKNSLGQPINGAIVKIFDKDMYQGSVSFITTSTGYYQVNIQSIANNGDTINVQSNNSDMVQFILNTNNPFKNINVTTKTYIKSNEANVSVGVI